MQQRPRRDDRLRGYEMGEFEAFYRATFGLVARSLFLLTDSRDEALEITQEAFVRTWDRWKLIRSSASPSSYTLRIASNLAKSALRRRRAWRKIALRSNPVDEAPVSETVAEAVSVRSALRSLSFRQRAAVVLVDLVDLAPPDAAALLGIAESTLRVHLSRGRSHLREQLGSLEVSDGGAQPVAQQEASS